MKITREEDYAITLINALAEHYDDQEYLGLRRIAHSHHLPELFLKQIAKKLKQAGLLKVKEGRGGGYRLAKPPQQISLEKVLRVFSPQPFLTSCLDTNHKIKCALYHRCQSRKAWQKISQQFYRSLKNINFEKLTKN